MSDLRIFVLDCLFGLLLLGFLVSVLLICFCSFVLVFLWVFDFFMMVNYWVFWLCWFFSFFLEMLLVLLISCCCRRSSLLLGMFNLVSEIMKVMLGILEVIIGVIMLFLLCFMRLIFFGCMFGIVFR